MSGTEFASLSVVSRFHHRGRELEVSYEELLEMLRHLNLNNFSEENKEEIEECLRQKFGSLKIIQVVGNQQISLARQQINIDKESLSMILESLAALIKGSDERSGELLKELLRAILRMAN